MHNLANFVLYTFLHLPSVTVQRCYNNNHDLIMCLPDFEPSFNLLVAGLRNLGMLLDNWLDVASIIVQKSLGLDPKAECEAQALLLAPASYSRAVFGNNQTIVVGLTPGLYAVTDGTHAQYFNHYDSIESTILPNAWPIPIDVRYGVAAVTYTTMQRDGATGEASTTMMGCRSVLFIIILRMHNAMTLCNFVTTADALTTTTSLPCASNVHWPSRRRYHSPTHRATSSKSFSSSAPRRTT